MEIQVTHTLTLSDDTKQFLKELFAKPAVNMFKEVSAVAAVEDTPVAPAEPEERKKVVPNGIAVTRIGQETEAAIMKLLPADIETIEKAIKRKRFDAEGLLKLLWTRSKIGYDGNVHHVR